MRGLSYIYVALACGAVMASSSLADATGREQTGMLGVAAPKGLGDPHRPILDVSALRPAPAIVPAGEESNRDLVGATIRKDLEAIVGFSAR
jgi:hypothetical protein